MNCILRCSICGKYTLDLAHCGKETRRAHPPKFMIEDRYAKYRREARYPKDGSHD
ncbi:MAG: nucleolar RNA-binding Nop10p family protein [Candidatus Micrarchaeia archaeon]